MTEYSQEHNIIHEVTVLYTPQSNDVAERKNRTLMDMMNYMLLGTGASENLWGEALLSTCFILNRVPKETPMLLNMNVGKGELLTSNSSKFVVTWLRFQYRN